MLINRLCHYCGKQVHSVEHEICLQTREADSLFKKYAILDCDKTIFV